MEHYEITSDPLRTLHGWGDFARQHGVAHCFADTVRTFGAAMCGYADSRRLTRSSVLSAVNYVAVDIRRCCQRLGVPLWPALVDATPTSRGLKKRDAGVASTRRVA